MWRIINKFIERFEKLDCFMMFHNWDYDETKTIRVCKYCDLEQNKVFCKCGQGFWVQKLNNAERKSLEKHISMGCKR